MDKLHFETPNLTEQNIDRIAELFPGVITEKRDENGKLTRAVNFELLKQQLSPEVLAGDEAYEFTWVGKKASIVEANRPIRKTLRPCKEESKDWDTTENLYIEGDNLDVLKLLQESYLGKVKMIYIDPPYNTGHDFIYNDRFEMDEEEYNQQIGLFDEEQNRNFRENNESNPRFHSDWCSMMYSRLLIARNLLHKDGVIFISIDDSENSSLRKICDEVFSEDCFLGCIVRSTGQTTGQDSGGLGSSFDYILAYTSSSDFELSGLSLNEHDLKRFENEDERGKYAYDQLRKTGSSDLRTDRPNMYYPIIDPDGNELYPTGPSGYDSRWRFEKKTYDQMLETGFILWKKTMRNQQEIWWPYVKYYLEGRTKRPSPLWTDLEGNKKASRDVRSLFDGKKVFDYAKPIELMVRLMQITPDYDKQGVFLDFFSGSSTTAHAVMQLNAEDGGHRKFIMVQLPEPCDEKSEAYKAGYKNICEIGKERIRRAGAKIKSEAGLMAQTLDTGFRVFKLDETNMKDVFYSAEEYTQARLDDMISNIKEDRTDLDLLYGCLLEWGLPLSLPHVTEEIEGCHVHTVNGGDLIACFDEDIPESVIKKIAQRKPLRVVFRDSSFASSPEKINVTEIFKLMAPGTNVRVI